MRLISICFLLAAACLMPVWFMPMNVTVHPVAKFVCEVTACFFATVGAVLFLFWLWSGDQWRPGR